MRKIRKVPPKDAFRDAILMNDRTYLDYLERMKKICLSMFEWINLPDSCNARFLEMCLFYNGQAALLYDDDYGYINTMAADGGYINIYGLPTELNCYSYRFNKRRSLYTVDMGEEKDKECILVMNNYERVPTTSTISLFAYRLAEAQRTADVNIKANRTPILLTTDQKQIFTLKKMYEEYDGNTPAIFADKNLLSPDALKAIKTEAPFLVNDIYEYKREIWNEMLTFLGIQNLSEKRERLITGEVDSNNELLNLNLQSLLVPRKEACRQFNEKFGLMGDKAIDVKVRSDLYNIVKQYESITSDYNVALKDQQKLGEIEDE
ncbi:MAG: hypothetical protein J6S67_09175 [Methanobrevibacter sp.]|nr:hypothetical protein [Methanobrevibacter sp.]